MLKEKKRKLRESVLATLTRLSTNQKREIERELENQLYNSEIWQKAKVIGITSATSIEWNTEPMIKRAWEQNKTIAIPKTIPARSEMNFFKITSFNELKVGYANILEPNVSENRLIDKNDIDLIIVPGIVFDKKGYRIGFGGGYYDRFLVDFLNHTASIVSERQLVDTLPTEKHDIPVQFLITENGMLKTAE